MSARKRLPLVPWSLLLAAALALVVVGRFTPLPMVVAAWTAALFVVGVGVWVALWAVRTRKRRGGERTSLVGDPELVGRARADAERAVSRYLASVKRARGGARAALYGRQWLLVCGPPGAGMSTLLTGSGMDIPVRYPTADDGAVIDGDQRTSWLFANNAVWIDTPGAYTAPEGSAGWRATLAALARVRSECPVDGMVVTVNVAELLGAEASGAREIAGMIRGRIDEAIASWGVELPVYLVLTHTDAIPGFAECVGREAASIRRGVLGAAMTGEQSSGSARAAFDAEFPLLCASVNDLRLRALANERDGAKRRLICRFAIHFESLQRKLAVMVAELFKDTSYEGRPVFAGFFFTALGAPPEQEQGTRTGGRGGVATVIAQHHLNPHRESAGRSDGGDTGRVPATRTLLARTVLDRIVPSRAGSIRRTQRRSRAETGRMAAALGAIALVALTALGMIGGSALRVRRLAKNTAPALAGTAGSARGMEERYRALHRTAEAVARVQREVDRGAPIWLPFTYGVPKRLLEASRRSYFAELRRLVLGPALRRLEYDIRIHAESFGDLDGEEYGELYGALKAYLSISEAVAADRGVIDTAFLRPALTDALTGSLTGATGDPRLPRDVESSIHDNIGLYLRYLVSGDFPLVQEDQRLVVSARRRLVRLPDAGALYRTTIGRVSRNMPTVSLTDLVGEDPESVLRSERTIALIYSPEGWRRYVAPALGEASKNPYRIDWVVGRTERDFPQSLLDPGRLHRNMVAAYVADVEEQWLTFLASVRVVPSATIEDAARSLQRLGGEQSELARLLEEAAKNTAVSTKSALREAGEKAAEVAKKGVKLKGKAKKAAALAGVDGGGEDADPDEAVVGNRFDYLRVYLRSVSGDHRSFGGYREALAGLGSELAAAKGRDSEGIIAMFNGGENDRLLAAWRHAGAALSAMPGDLAGALDSLLMQPVGHAGHAVSRRLAVEINERWREEVARPFAGRFAGRYPFAARGEAAAFEDVMELFRPATGTFWGFVGRNLAAYYTRSEGRWKPRSVGSVTVPFREETGGALDVAESIRRALYRPDGTHRHFVFTIAAVPRSTHRASLVIGHETQELGRGGGSARVRWPHEGGETERAALRVHLDRDFTQEIAADGAWGFVRLLEQGEVDRVAPGKYTVRWKVNVQNMYTALVVCRVSVSDPAFVLPSELFGRFHCPETVASGVKSAEMNDER